MRRTLFCLLLLACCVSVFAMEVNPPAPDSQTFLKVNTKTPFCSVARTDVSVQGFKITVNVIPNASACPTGTLFPLQANVGVVPPGVYDVVVRTLDGSELDHSAAIVRDAGSDIIVSPVGGRIEGGRAVQIFGAGIGTVLFDGVPATDVHIENGSLVATPPAHAAGTVDVVVNDQAREHRSVAAFTYFDPAAAPDPFVFEPVLFPVAYNGPGLFNSKWTTNNTLATGHTLVRFKDSIPALACTGSCSQFDFTATLAPESQSGLLVWAVRRRLPVGVEDDFRVASRIFESVLHGAAGTGLPVAREHDFRNGFAIDDLPIDGSSRVLLRLYSPTNAAQTVDVVTTFDESADVQHLTLQPIKGVAYATLDIGSIPHFRSGKASITVRSSAKVWGLVTATDNNTQDVTAFWPR